MKFLGKFRVLLVLGIIIIIFSSFSAVTDFKKSKGNFVSFTVLNNGTVVVGTTYAITGYNENKEIFSFPVFFNQDYALNTNVDDNIIVYTKGGKFRFTTDGTPLSAQKNSSKSYEEFKNRNVIYTDTNEAYCLTKTSGNFEILKITADGNFLQYAAPQKNSRLNVALVFGFVLILVSVLYSVSVYKNKKKRLEYLENLDFVNEPSEPVEPVDTIKTHYVTYKRKPENLKPTQFVFLPDFKKAFSKPETNRNKHNEKNNKTK